MDHPRVLHIESEEDWHTIVDEEVRRVGGEVIRLETTARDAFRALGEVVEDGVNAVVTGNNIAGTRVAEDVVAFAAELGLPVAVMATTDLSEVVGPGNLAVVKGSLEPRAIGEWLRGLPEPGEAPTQSAADAPVVE